MSDTTTTRRLRLAAHIARSKVIDGVRRYAIGYGIKVGYWPCYRAPYVLIAVGRRRLTLWYGPVLSLEKPHDG